jgi:tetratricopeptide (TPR) repeat protein
MNPPVLVEPCNRHEKRARHKRYPSTVRSNRLEPTRIQILEQMVAQNPANSFARYGLAMEYVKSGDLARGVVEFDSLLAADPAYSAAYFHGGQTLEKLGRLDEAREYYRKGIAVTRDPHARSELQAALDILGD